MPPVATLAPAHTGAGDLTRSLTRQSLLVAGVCLVADALAFVLSGPVAAIRPQDWLILAMLVVVDAALALLHGFPAGSRWHMPSFKSSRRR
ncbi:hypothetical protein [Mycolicibacterium goodii]|uniref:hypothetical protein n=1 Tax=Mycolicibacterium goodii TaxID=134601 RepID=UPI001BDCD0F4|nr:hypothetical protein [Mycolicibacterium goodii]MBU8829771.1 hypothetical protein [Mycolicibacterium goodii]